MAVPGSIDELLIGAANAGAGAGVKEIERSLRFNTDDSAYLNHTPTAAGDRRIFTYSTWVKRSSISDPTEDALFSVGVSPNNIFEFNSSGRISLTGN